jgi:hypothetical protein
MWRSGSLADMFETRGGALCVRCPADKSLSARCRRPVLHGDRPLPGLTASTDLVRHPDELAKEK